MEYTLFKIDIYIRNMPGWYKRINPLGKVRMAPRLAQPLIHSPRRTSTPQVPAITFGGPQVPPEEPSPESQKLYESLALLEFVADAFPESKLLPADPVLRARARTFISLYHSYVHEQFRNVFFRGAPVTDAFFQGFETLQSALPPTGFAAGEWSLAEAAVAPFLARVMLYLDAGFGWYSEADGESMRAALASARFARLQQYVQDVRTRPSFAKTWGGDVSSASILASPDAC